MDRRIPRRQLLSALGGAGITSVAGCTAAEDGTTAGADTSNGTGSETTDTTTEPTCREAVFAVTRPSETAVGEILSDATVEASMRQESGERHHVLRGVDRSEVEEQFLGHNISVLFIGTVDWCSQPVCDARAFLLLESDAEVEQMRSDFPDSITILRGESTRGEIRVVYSAASSHETLSDRARQEDYETATAVSGNLSVCEISSQSRTSGSGRPGRENVLRPR